MGGLKDKAELEYRKWVERTREPLPEAAEALERHIHEMDRLLETRRYPCGKSLRMQQSSESCSS